MEAAGDLELSADAGHTVQLGVVSAPEWRHRMSLTHGLTMVGAQSRGQVRMREGRVVMSEVGRGQRQQGPGVRHHPRRGHRELCEALFRVHSGF